MREKALVQFIVETAGMTKLNEAWCWGSELAAYSPDCDNQCHVAGNKQGQLGVGTMVSLILLRQCTLSDFVHGVQVPMWEQAGENPCIKKEIPVQVCCGNYFTAFLTESRAVFTCGDGTAGQLGQFDAPLSLTSEFIANIKG